MNFFNDIRKRLRNGIFGEPAAGDEVCPICHKKDEVVPIRYGKPNKQLMEQAQKGKVRLGGCMAADRPHRYCKRDDLEF